MIKLFITVLTGLSIILFSPSIFAVICEKLSGEWTGEWQDERHKIYAAQLQINPVNLHHFAGKFSLSDGGNGLINGKCKEIKKMDNEAYLMLRKDAPWYNPCRGTILQDKKTFLLYFFCFNPNQSGYFTKKAVIHF